MKIIGLCGGSGAGKSAASAAIYALGGEVIDADRVYRELCVPGSACLAEIENAFGPTALTESGALNRPAVAAIIYGDPEKRALLNAITHKHIKAETERRLEEYREKGVSAVVVDAPLLFEAGFDKMCDVTVGIVADRAFRIARIVARDGVDEATAERRIDSQMPDSLLSLMCDHIIENNGSAAQLYDKATQLFANIIEWRLIC